MKVHLQNVPARTPILTTHEAQQTYTRATIIEDYRALILEEQVVEVRIPNTSQGVVSGYFNDPDKLAEEVLRYNGRHNIFFTLNPCPQNLPVTINKLFPHAKRTTKDSDILKRSLLLIDIDPKRPSGTSATDEEQRFALEMAIEVAAFLSTHGFPAPAFASSGNGLHLLYKIDMPNDKENTATIKSFLTALSQRFSDETTDIDTSVYNAARICKLYGTMAVKGENTTERPHRQSKILNMPEPFDVLPAEQIKAVTALLAPPATPEQSALHAGTPSTHSGYGDKFDVEAFISKHGIEVVVFKDEGDKKTWRIACPFKEHEDKAAFIQQFSKGAISAGCHHDKCKWGWSELRAKFDPDYAHRQEVRKEAADNQPPERLIAYDELLRSQYENMMIDSEGRIMILQGSGKNLHWVELANFVPIPHEIIYEVDNTDGDVKLKRLKIGGQLAGGKEIKPITIDIDQLYRDRWVMSLDLQAIINPEVRSGRELVRAIVQRFSCKATKKHIYTHLGFREVDGKLGYLHAHGAIGLDNVSVDLEQNNLSGYAFEDISTLTAEDRRECIKTSLQFFDLYPRGNVLLAYVFLAPLYHMFAQHNNMPAFSLWLYGKSGSQKTTVAALMMNFFGPDFSNTNLPLSFNDTENSLTKKLALCKDSLSVIDDVVHPTANHGDIKRQRKLAQDMVFNIANRTGRGRMRADESLKKTLTPQGMVVFTAEYPFDDVGESTTTRLLSVEFEPGSVDLDILTDCQKRRADLNRTMACYIEWLIQNAESLQADLQREFEALRASLALDLFSGVNMKMMEMGVFMSLSMDCLARFFTGVGAVDADFSGNTVKQLQTDLKILMEKQALSIVSTSPTEMFMDVIGNLFADRSIYTEEIGGGIIEQSSGRARVGWHDKSYYYFIAGENTSSVYIAVKQHYQRHGRDFDIQPKELYRRLADEGVTVTDRGRPNKVKTIKGKSHRVLVIPRSTIDRLPEDEDSITSELDELFPLE